MSSIFNAGLLLLLQISSLFFCLTARAQELPQRYLFSDQVTAFMHQLHIAPAELKELNSDHGNDALQNKEQLKKMTFYKQLQDFLQQHQHTYFRIRQYEFEKLLPPPSQLETRLKRAPAGHDSWTQVLEDPDLLKLICLKTLTPAAMAVSVSIQVLPFFPEDAVDRKAQLRGFAGRLVYGRKYGNNNWRVWYISRSLSIAFDINLVTMQLSGLSYIPLKQLQDASIHFTPTIRPRDAIDTLWLDESSYRWKIEHHAANRPDVSYAQEILQKMDGFYTRNATRYADCRRLLLSRFLPPVSNGAVYREQADSSLLSDLISSRSYPSIATIDAADVTSQLPIPIITRLHPNEKPDYQELAIESITGFLHRAEKTADPDTWNIQATGRKKQIVYRWNIKTGNITVMHYDQKIL